MSKLFIALGILATVLVACGESPSSLPERLAGMDRAEVATGAQADRFLASLRLAAGDPRSSELAHYSGAQGSATVYLARYAGAEQARRVLDGLLADVRSGGTPFRAPEPAARPAGAFQLSGLDQHCRVWRAGDTLLWVHGEPAAIEQACAELARAAEAGPVPGEVESRN